MRIYDILPVGEENAIPGEEIGRRLGITRRERRAMAAQELENGLFVLYTTTRPGGYFRPAEGEKGRQELAGSIIGNRRGDLPASESWRQSVQRWPSAAIRPHLTRRETVHDEPAAAGFL